MPTFVVQLWPDGKWDGKDYVRVDEPTEKEAAEKLYRKPLPQEGSNHQIRAQVRPLTGRSTSTIFYDRNT
jgi:hypothetical protein